MISYRRIPVNIVIVDSGPLISLAAVDRLDLLDSFSRPVTVSDVVAAECLRYPEKLGANRLTEWFRAFDGKRFRVMDTPLLPLWRDAVAEEEGGSDHLPSKGIGDASIAWLLHELPRLNPGDELVLVLTEDAGLGDGLIRGLGPQFYLLSTRMLLKTLENFGVISSAETLLSDIAAAGRSVSRYAVDRPGRLEGQRKSSWTDPLVDGTSGREGE
ncbi:hypothetical protein M2360_003974 [Rhizobium sp. SG_E_25_P2]|uniref:hypothetical protein n=1 Tax=Rhizobium sp. SG_E_25_P2 TaxID=2879942 RepID=UPI002475F035|nr:hypothetical protein [Rhizobium sp. SG_E_25_P2]MDH6268568.1 hypothetical protein [Rhizobium sp. SG_E_25_P2]